MTTPHDTVVAALKVGGLVPSMYVEEVARVAIEALRGDAKARVYALIAGLSTQEPGLAWLDGEEIMQVVDALLGPEAQ